MRLGGLWVRGEERGGRVRGFWGTVELQLWWIGNGSVDEEVDDVLDGWGYFCCIPLLILHEFGGLRDMCLVKCLQECLRLQVCQTK